MRTKRTPLRRRRTGASRASLALARAITKTQAASRRASEIAAAAAAAQELAAPYVSADAIKAQKDLIAQRILSPAPRNRGSYNLGSFLRQAEGYADRFIKRGIPNILHAGQQVASAVNPLIQAYRGKGLYSGRGGYNNLIEGGDPSMIYHSGNDETESIVISNCEYLQDIYGPSSSSFSIESWRLNPGLLENFPWLSQIAQNYEEYEFIQLLYHFKSTVDSTTANTNGSTGTMIMCTNYNPDSGIFTNKETMMQYHGANSGRLTEDHTHGVECDPAKNAMSAQKYIRSLPPLPGEDLKDYDLGTFQLAQVNVPSSFQNQQVGELWVTYSVKLRKPKLSSALCLATNECRFASARGDAILYSKLLGSTVKMAQNTLPISVVQDSPTGTSGRIKIVFPDFLTGLFEVQIFLEGSSFSTSTDPSVVTAGNVSLWDDLLAAGVNATASSNTSNFPSNQIVINTSTRCLILARYYIQPVTGTTDNSVAWTIDLGGSLNINNSSLIVRQCNPSFGNKNVYSASTNMPLYVNDLGYPALVGTTN